ncbi:MAG: hypothetical protein FWG99_10615 [Treponema sp.]|nr:hypothetical protein [Treponema sp.]
MKKTRILTICSLLLACLMIFSGCQNIFQPDHNKSSGGNKDYIPAGFGLLRVSFSHGSARTAVPGRTIDLFDHLTFIFTIEGEVVLEESRSPENITDPFLLQTGTYVLTVKAYIGEDEGSLAAEGESEPFTIRERDSDSVSISLEPKIEDGYGTLNFRLGFPPNATVEKFTLGKILDEDSVFNLLEEFLANPPQNPFDGEKTNIPAGFYLLTVLLSDDDYAFAGRTEVVHIYANMTTVVDYTFVPTEFRANVVTNDRDYAPDSSDTTIPGSLRHVLENTEAGVIMVMLGPGSVIELKSSLMIDKSITIEGNGVTLTRSASFSNTLNGTETTGDGGNDQLVVVKEAYGNPSGLDVKISRVYFKDGRADYGGAIRNGETLTLQSCIFSGNKASSGGGAIYNNGTMTVNGCTFYKNSAEKGGGAICNEDKLFFAGNIFYGNTDFDRDGSGNYSVIYPGTGTTISMGYNVVDRSEGSNAAQCGWSFLTGDTHVTELPISPKTFRLLSNGATVNIPTVFMTTNGYPKKDFNGSVIAVGAAAGAVQESAGSGFYLDLAETAKGTIIIISGSRDTDGLVSGQIILQANAAGSNSFIGWEVDGVNTVSTSTLSLTLNKPTWVRAVFSLPPVTSLSDTNGSMTNVTLRYALSIAEDGDVISLSGVTAGENTTELNSGLVIDKNVTIEGNGITLIKSGSWVTVDRYSQLLRNEAKATIRRVHFKDGRADDGGAINNNGVLTLESCIFSGNVARLWGGAIYNNPESTLTIKGCTFYKNICNGDLGGAIDNDGILHLIGNLFYGNTGLGEYNSNVVTSSVDFSSYNVVDWPSGIGPTNCGWTFGTGDKLINVLPFSPITFRLLTNDADVNIPANDYPAKDFYGNDIPNNARAGAVQAMAAGSGYYLDLVENVRGRIEVTSVNKPDADGLVSGSVTLTATGYGDCDFSEWLVDGSSHPETNNSLTLNIGSHTKVEAKFSLPPVTALSDSAGSITNVTLRYALSIAEDGEVIKFKDGVVTTGTSEIRLNSTLMVDKEVTIEGNGITLTKNNSWTYDGQLMRNEADNVIISRIHFKDGLASGYSGAINNSGDLTLESCIFSGNKTTSGAAEGGAIFNSGTLIVSGCTFHNNNTGSFGGGAIYNYYFADLVLTGNLFYGNTAVDDDGDSYFPVVRDRNYGVFSNGYNVVDWPSGTGPNDCGWVFDTDDRTFEGAPPAGLGITGDPFNTTTFVPVAGLGNFITSPPAGFPTTDFEGKTRINGTPGAVD